LQQAPELAVKTFHPFKSFCWWDAFLALPPGSPIMVLISIDIDISDTLCISINKISI
jgi:hypothetical protein